MVDDNEKYTVDDADVENAMEFPAVSRVIFDERTGTVTLRLATAEEIAEARGMRNEE